MENERRPSPETYIGAAESVCSACRGQSKLAYERAPYRVKEGLWAHKPSPGYCHKAAVCPASAIWEKKNG